MSVRTLRRLLAVPAAMLVAVAFAVPAAADPGARSPANGSTREVTKIRSVRPAKVDRRLTTAIAKEGSVEALLILNGDAALQTAEATTSGGSRALLRAVVPAYGSLKDDLSARFPGIRVLRDYRTLPILHVVFRSQDQLDRAAADPSVAGIAANRTLRASLTESLALIGQPAAAASGFTGDGTAVAVLDTGLDFTRAAFGTCPTPGAPGCRVIIAQDFAPDDGLLDDPGQGRHGTNVAGIVAGVAPDADLLGLDVFDGGGASNGDILDAIDFTIANQSTFNIVAMNLSLGDVSFHTNQCGGGNNPFAPAFATALAAGIAPVVAAGNNAAGQFAGVANPACTPGAFSVGAVYDADVGGISYSDCEDATTQTDQITCFSQAASFLTALAPGALITAANITQAGTSQATPHVAGGVAVLMESLPTATPSMVETAIHTSGPLIFDSLVGTSFHRLNLPAAISTLAGLPPPPPPDECTILGTGAAELLQGTPGDDVICGEGGGDTILLGGGGTDVVNGGPGFDFISLEDAASGGTIDLTAGVAAAGPASATLESIEGAVGSPFDDVLTGSSGDNDFAGLGGDDVIDGKGGFDFGRFDFATNRIRADLDAGISRGEGTDELSAIEGFIGSAGNDRLLGDNKTNVIDGGRGNDLVSGLGKADGLFGGAGSDDLLGGKGNDDLFGGPGNDDCDQGPGSGAAQSC
ncbi:MAG TPA: S8 family serine peptidase [Actinomycetota bacterium]